MEAWRACSPEAFTCAYPKITHVTVTQDNVMRGELGLSAEGTVVKPGTSLVEPRKEANDHLAKNFKSPLSWTQVCSALGNEGPLPLPPPPTIDKGRPPKSRRLAQTPTTVIHGSLQSPASLQAHIVVGMTPALGPQSQTAPTHVSAPCESGIMLTA